MATSANPSEAPRPPGVFARVFGLDVRSLALTRVSLATIVLADLWIRAGDLAAFHADSGLLPRAAWLKAYAGAFSLHAASGRPGYQALLFAVHACAALMLLVGWRTRIATFVTWLLLVSLHARNPAILQAGDSLLAVMLFWSLFVPLGATLSVDAALAPEGAQGSRRITSVGTLALALQMPCVYFFTGLLKGGPAWHSSFDAVPLALKDDFISSPLGAWVAQTLPTGLLRGLTVGTLVLELGLPLLLLAPLRTASLRLALLPVLIVLQLGFFACLRIGLFPLISTTAALVLLPAELWDRLSARLERSQRAVAARAWLAARAASVVARLGRAGRSAPRFELGRAATVVCGAALLFAIADNVGSVTGSFLPRPVTEVARTLRIRQSWKMFVRPSKAHRWVVLAGTLENGERVDLLAGDGREPSLERPEHISDTFENYRWRKYFGNVSAKAKPQVDVQRRALASYLCRSYNAGRPEGERLESVVALRFSEPAEGDAAPSRSTLFRKRCPAPPSERPSAPEKERDRPERRVSARSI